MFGFVGGLINSLGGSRFTCQLHCYPAAFAGKEELETSNRLVLPPSALEKLTKLEVPSPMIFSVSDLDGRRKTHAGVLEFNAPEDQCFMPLWMLRQLEAEEGDVLQISLVNLPKATSVKFRPASVALMRVYNPRALLENVLRNFVALTTGDTFAVSYNSQMYGIEVVETKPADAVSIFETDVHVEFAPPQGSVASRDPDSASRQQQEQVRPVAAEKQPQNDEEEDPMPWKRRIPGGVKWTVPPYGFADLNDQSKAKQPAEAATSSSARPVRPGTAPTSQSVREMRSAALQAAERRMAEQAEEIEERRKQEEENERERALQEEAEAKAAAAKAAAAAARRKKVAEAGAAKSAAPVQQSMSKGSKGKKKDLSAKPRSQRSWCNCLWPAAPRQPAEGKFQGQLQPARI
mmetsp:Transcript_23424/g.54535  ORF Transcript_23424/g.54535 Transcript_23424/m.54535 type:complete len:405 (+) Transcript_23424:179-1393(+)